MAYESKIKRKRDGCLTNTSCQKVELGLELSSSGGSRRGNRVSLRFWKKTAERESHCTCSSGSESSTLENSSLLVCSGGMRQPGWGSLILALQSVSFELGKP